MSFLSVSESNQFSSIRKGACYSEDNFKKKDENLKEKIYKLASNTFKNKKSQKLGKSMQQTRLTVNKGFESEYLLSNTVNTNSNANIPNTLDSNVLSNVSQITGSSVNSGAGIGVAGSILVSGTSVVMPLISHMLKENIQKGSGPIFKSHNLMGVGLKKHPNIFLMDLMELKSMEDIIKYFSIKHIINYCDKKDLHLSEYVEIAEVFAQTVKKLCAENILDVDVLLKMKENLFRLNNTYKDNYTKKPSGLLDIKGHGLRKSFNSNINNSLIKIESQINKAHEENRKKEWISNLQKLDINGMENWVDTAYAKRCSPRKFKADFEFMQRGKNIGISPEEFFSQQDGPMHVMQQERAKKTRGKN